MVRNALVLNTWVLIGAWMALLAGPAAAKPYKGAEIYSTQTYLYGRFEMRMRMASGSGVLSTFFTYKDGSEKEGAFWEEIDIEVFGKNNAEHWQSNIILGSSRPTVMKEADHTAPSSLAEAYHTYVLEWTPDYVAWFLDGEEVRRITGSSTVTSLTSAQSLRFNIWASNSVPWAGAWNDNILPVYQYVDYMVYQPYNSASKTFGEGWRDDFDSFNSSRWAKANWTFDGNRVDFAPDNVVIKDGILVLALTHENATGYSGTPPQAAAASSESSSSSASQESSSAPSSSLASASSPTTSSTSAASSSYVASSPASSSGNATTSAATSNRAAKSGGNGGLGVWLLLLLAPLVYRR